MFSSIAREAAYKNAVKEAEKTKAEMAKCSNVGECIEKMHSLIDKLESEREAADAGY
jgi:hypothetical protein